VSDLKTLKHRHVQVVKENGAQYLLLSVTKSKTANRDSANDAYERCSSVRGAVSRSDLDKDIGETGSSADAAFTWVRKLAADFCGLAFQGCPNRSNWL